MNSSLIGNVTTQLFMALIGLILLLPSAYKLCTYSIFRYQAFAVSGVIATPLHGRDMGAKPLVEYKDTRGNVYEIKSEAKTHWFFSPQKGEKIKVFFLKHDPQTAIVDSSFHYIVLPLFFVVIGTAVVIGVFKSIWQELRSFRADHT